MALIVSQFFQIIGLNMTPPTTLGELIPYLLTVCVGVVLVCGVFRVIGRLAGILMDYKRW